jgi:hypothetical protein
VRRFCVSGAATAADSAFSSLAITAGGVAAGAAMPTQ